MSSINDLRLRVAEIDQELGQFASRSSFTPDEDVKIKNLFEERETATRSIKLEELRAAAGNGTTIRENANDGLTGAGFNVNKNRAISDPWDSNAAPAYDRARAAAEKGHIPETVREDASRHRATKLVEEYRDAPVVQEWMLAGEDPAYIRAFSKLVRDPANAALTMSDVERAALVRSNTVLRALNEGTGSAGAFLVPPYLDPTIILTNAGTQNPWRQVADVKQIPTQTWKGVSSAGVTAEWVSESTEAADASPTLAQPSITPIRYDAYIQASFEHIMDTNITSEVSVLVADAVDRLQGTAFAVGTGSTQPKGVITALAGITASRVNAQTNGSFGLVDVYAVLDSLPARARQNASWVAHPKTATRIRRFGEGTVANAAYWTDLTGGTDETRDVPRLLGDPFYLSSDISNNITSGSNSDTIVVGDFRKSFAIVDRIGTGLVFNPLVLGASHRPTGEAGWYFFGRTGSDVVDGGNSLRMLVQL